MNKKGFTIVELLLTIVILALVILIAVPSINGFSKMIQENQRENNIKNIEIAASKYAFDTGKTIIFVEELIKEGYIESDNEGNIDDPLNNGTLNCYVVEMEKVSDYYKAKFIDGKNYYENDACNLNKLQEDTGEIYIEVLNNGVSVSADSWLSGSVTLSANGKTSLSILCNVNKCAWTSSSGANVTGSNEIKIEHVSTTLNTIYTFQYSLYSGTTDVTRYMKSINLKIDNEAPIIYGDELKVTDKFIYTPSKKVTISASDIKGSGIAGYYLALNTGQSCYNSSLEFQSSNSFNISSNGNYLICVKDNAGNISSYNGLTINYIK